MSNMGKNVQLFSKFCNWDTLQFSQVYHVALKVYAHIKPDAFQYVRNDLNVVNAKVCRELIDMRDCLCEKSCVLTAVECSQLIEYLCTI